MKRTTIILFYLFLSIFSKAQDIAIEINSKLRATVSIENRVTIAVNKTDCNDIIVSTENGTIENDGKEGCKYIFLPETIGWTEISIYKVTSEEISLIEKKRIKVEPWPKHTARFGNTTSGDFSKSKFLALDGVNVPMQLGDISGYLKVVSYDIEINRKGKIINTLQNDGGRFTEENQAILEKIKEKDIITFKKILVKMPGEDEPRKLDDVKVWIIKS